LNPVGGGNFSLMALTGQTLVHVSHFRQGSKFVRGLSGVIEAFVRTALKMTLGPYSGVIEILGLP